MPPRKSGRAEKRCLRSGRVCFLSVTKPRLPESVKVLRASPIHHLHPRAGVISWVRSKGWTTPNCFQFLGPSFYRNRWIKNGAAMRKPGNAFYARRPEEHASTLKRRMCVVGNMTNSEGACCFNSHDFVFGTHKPIIQGKMTSAQVCVKLFHIGCGVL